MILLNKSDPESIGQGLVLVRQAASKGNALAEYHLARSYGAGRGVARDDAEAAAWYEKAALGGIKQAQQILAGMYERGEGVAADPAKAARWRAIADAPPAQVR